MTVIRSVRKRPVEVQAAHLSPENKDEIITWIKSGGFVVGWWDDGISIETPEGMMRAREGDWIVQGVRGEFYPVKPSIFDETYELLG